MYVPSILPTKIQSMKPTKRKIVKTVYTTEKISRNIQKDLPKEFRGAAQKLSETCHNIRNYITKVN